jgi:arylsulfatase
MITHFDNSVGRLVDLLKELNLYENTLLIFASDNGYSHRNCSELESTFEHSGPYRGHKGNIFQGGLRVPAFAHWANHVPGGTTETTPWAFYDFLPTMCELLGTETPSGLDGVSVLPTWLGRKGEQQERDFFYWQFNHEQAMRSGEYYIHRLSPSDPIEVFHAEADPRQENDLAEKHPDVVARANEVFADEHTESLYFPSPGETREQWWARMEKAGVVLPDNVNA